jgi:ribosome-associated translation inhibitor RaiA
MKIVFKNMEPSTLARQIVEEKLTPVIDKFPKLKLNALTVTLEMENSPAHAGPDLFTTWVVIKVPGARHLKLKRSDMNFYRAISLLSDGLMESLSQKHNENKRRITAPD